MLKPLRLRAAIYERGRVVEGAASGRGATHRFRPTDQRFSQKTGYPPEAPSPLRWSPPIKAYVDLGSELQDVSDRVGIQSRCFVRIELRRRSIGLEYHDLEKALRKMQVTIAEAANGSKSAQQALAALGLESKRLYRTRLPISSSKRLPMLWLRFPDTGDRIATAIDLMGKPAAELMPLFEQGAAGIQALATTGQGSRSVDRSRTSRQRRSLRRRFFDCRQSRSSLGLRPRRGRSDRL